jgi:hypothetical protein
MGGQLVKKVWAASFHETERGRALTANERQILLYMATVAHDSDAAPIYWAGRESLAAHALGRAIPDDSKLRESLYKSVSIATRSLVSRGAIRLHNTARPGKNQEYELTVDNLLPAKWTPEPDVPPLGM